MKCLLGPKLSPMPHMYQPSIRKFLSSFQPLRQSTKEVFVSCRKDLPRRWGTGSTERVEIQPGLELILTRYQLNHGVCLHLQVDRPMLSFGCVVSGKMSIRVDSLRTDTVLQGGDGINMWASEGNYSFRAAQGSYQSLSLELGQEFFARTMAHSGIVGIETIQKTLSRPSFPLHLSCKPLTPVARSAALSLLTSSCEDPLRSLLLESHALTILREQLLCFVPPHPSSSVPDTTSPRQTEQLEEVRRLLENSPEISPRLSELAARVGLNEWSLKRGFRVRFGVTVYDYLRAHRMKIADAMLCSGDFNVSETAFAVGYKNPGRFATAYRREFGIAPKVRQILFKNNALSATEAPSSTQTIEVRI
jgi:AraC family transcriptional regulator, transcriptional activator of the genes for pyochelin and ferripyochelin receptors